MLHGNYPEAIKTKTTKGLLPFHLAMTNLSTLTCLYELHDEAIRFTDKKGHCEIEVANKRGSLHFHVFELCFLELAFASCQSHEVQKNMNLSYSKVPRSKSSTFSEKRIQ